MSIDRETFEKCSRAFRVALDMIVVQYPYARLESDFVRSEEKTCAWCGVVEVDTRNTRSLQRMITIVFTWRENDLYTLDIAGCGGRFMITFEEPAEIKNQVTDIVLRLA